MNKIIVFLLSCFIVFMTFFSPLKIAYRALKAHKVRSALTVLGLLIGVSSIIIVMNMGQGIKGFVLKQVEIFGSDFIQVEVKVPSTAKNSSANAMNMAQGVTITTMKTDNAPENRSFGFTSARQNRLAHLSSIIAPDIWQLAHGLGVIGFHGGNGHALRHIHGIRRRIFGRGRHLNFHLNKIGTKNFHLF